MKTLEVLGKVVKVKRLEPSGGEVVDEGGVGDLVGVMFPGDCEGVAVRTLLKYEDLLLLRKILVWYASYNRSNNDVVRARELMKRMLHKGGSEFYSQRK